eukprot:gene9377-19453_t
MALPQPNKTRLFEILTTKLSSLLDHTNYPREQSIAIYSAWIGHKAPNTQKLNHCQYAMKQGYNFSLYFNTPSAWKSEVDGLSRGWAKVKHLLQLLNTDVDYIMYADFDTIFVTDQIRIEQFIDSNEKYSVLTQEVFNNSRMVQSHAFIMKNSHFTREFTRKWWHMRTECNDVNMEQGAYYSVVAQSFASLKPTATEYNCTTLCHRKGTGAFYRCYDNWMRTNGFGPGTTNTHPHIYIYPFRELIRDVTDGFTIHLKPVHRTAQRVISGLPFTVHPCKDQDKFLYHNPAILPYTCE